MTKRYKLRKLEVDRVDLVDVGANQFAEIVLAKAFDKKDEEETDPRAMLKEKMAAKFPSKEDTEAPPKPAAKPGGESEGLGIEEKPADSDDNDFKNGTKPFLKPKMKPKPKPGMKPGMKEEMSPGRKPLPPKGETVPMDEDEEDKKKNPFRGRGKAAPTLERGDEPLMKHGTHDQSSHGNWASGRSKGDEASYFDRDSPENVKRFLDMVADMNRRAGSGTFNSIYTDADIDMINAANAADAAARTRRTNTNTFDPDKHGPALRGAIDSALRYGNPMYESVTVVADDYGIPQDDKLMDWVFRESQKMKRDMEEEEGLRRRDDRHFVERERYRSRWG